MAANNKEIINIAGASSVNIAWSPARAALFGAFPEVEIYLQDGFGTYTKNSFIQPVPNAAPPSFTNLNIDFGSPTTGFISIM